LAAVIADDEGSANVLDQPWQREAACGIASDVENTMLRPSYPGRGRMKHSTAPAVETVAVEVIEQAAPGVITVTEVEDTDLRKVS
jgi:hypothetical protein